MKPYYKASIFKSMLHQGSLKTIDLQLGRNLFMKNRLRIVQLFDQCEKFLQTKRNRTNRAYQTVFPMLHNQQVCEKFLWMKHIKQK